MWNGLIPLDVKSEVLFSMSSKNSTSSFVNLSTSTIRISSVRKRTSARLNFVTVILVGHGQISTNLLVTFVEDNRL